MKTKVSVLTPVYNAEPYLAEAIESILTQTFSDFEFLLVDDGSSDGSPQILRDYAKQDKRIRVLTLPDNRGMPYALNYGLKRARAPLIARMDGDDISLPERLRVQYHYMQRHPDIGVLGCQGIFFTQDEKTHQNKILSSFPFSTSDEEMRELYKCGLHPVGHPFAMYRLSLAIEAGGYREFFRIGSDDQDLFQRLWDKTQVVNLPETLVWYRQTSPTSLFAKNAAASAAGSFMAILCALYRQAGREDPIEAVKSLDDLPAYLGLPRSVTLKDLQTTGHWAIAAIRRQLRKYPIERRAKRKLYGYMTKIYKDHKVFADRKLHWARYFFFVWERELLFSSLLHGRER